jgi:hypothetical protein
MSKSAVLDQWSTLTRFLPEDYEALAAEHQQVETKFGNAKIRDADTLLRFILLHVGADLPLRQTVAVMAEAGGPRIAPMRLHKKMVRAAPYLQALVQRIVGWEQPAAAERWGGYVLCAVDATTVSGPGSCGTDARIHTKLRVADVSLIGCEVTDASEGETFRRFEWHPGELAVGDRAYAASRGIEHVLDQGADVLVRYRLDGVTLLYPSGAALDVLAAVRSLKVGQTCDLDVVADLAHRKAHGRLIAYRLPPDAVQRARKRLQRDNGGPLSDRVRDATNYVLLFTTVRRDRLDAERCLQGYRLRWQVELQFKRWKSLCGFDRLPNWLDDTVLSWVYAKLLLGALLDRMASIPNELSPPEQQRIDRVPTVVMRPLEADQHPLATDDGGPASFRAA